MKRISIGAGLAALAGIALLACGPTTQQFSITYAEKRATLPNGLRMVIIPDPNTNLVQVDVRYEVGQKEDPPGKAGLAHFVEHMMFQHRFGAAGTPIEQRLPTFQVLPQIATFFNAYTNWDTTHYMLQAPKEDLETLLKLEAARMATGCDTIPEAEFVREREVVRNEIRQRGGTPEGQVYQQILNVVYPAQHAYREMMGGNDQQLTSITFQDVCKFMQDYYVPANATVYVVGDVNPDAVGAMISRTFGGLTDRKPAPHKEVAAIELSSATHEVKLDLERDQINVAFAMPSVADEAAYQAAQFMLFVVASNLDRFAQEWEVGEIGIQQLGGSYAPVAVVTLELAKGVSVEDGMEYIWKAVNVARRNANLLLEDGSYQDEKLSRTLYKQNLIGQLEAIENRAQIIAQMVQFDDSVDFSSSDVYLFELLDRVEEISTEGYEDLVKKIFDRDRAVVLVARADASGIKGDERDDFVYQAGGHHEEQPSLVDPAEAQRPLDAPESSSILGKAERYTLPNGMKVVLLAYDGMPIAHAQLVFDVGAVHESPDKAGLADVAASFLSLPLGANAYARTGVSIRGSSGSEATVFTARGINIYLDVIIKGLERIVKAGEINQEAIERYQDDFKAYFGRESYQRDYTYALELATALYGKEHPYVTTGDPTPKTLARIGRDEAMDFVRTHYTAKNATLIVVGNFDPKVAKGLIADNFGDWDGGRDDDPRTAAAPARTQPEYIGVIGREGQPQMQVTIAYPAPAGIDDQHAARLVLAEMLNLRMSRVRSELGSTYGTYAGKSTQLGPSAYRMGGNLDAPRAGESLAFMRAQIEALRQGDGFDRDFAAARRIIFKRYLAESTVSASLAGKLTSIARFGLGPDYYDDLVRRIATVTPAQVKALLASELDPSKEIIVGLADRPTLEAAFQQAGITDFRLVEPSAQ